MKQDSNSDVKESAEASLATTYNGMLELVSGFAAGGVSEWLRTVGRLLQFQRGVGYLKRLQAEVEHYKGEARIKTDYFYTDQGMTCMQELLNAIDEDSPDEVRFKTLQAILLTAASETLSTRDDPMPQQLMRIARQLSSAEVLVLSASYHRAKHPIKSENSSSRENGHARVWADAVLQHSGLRFVEMVLLQEEGLVQKKLLSENLFGDKSGYRVTNHDRLTELGYHLCEFIAAFEPQK